MKIKACNQALKALLVTGLLAAAPTMLMAQSNQPDTTTPPAAAAPQADQPASGMGDHKMMGDHQMMNNEKMMGDDKIGSGSMGKPMGNNMGNNMQMGDDKKPAMGCCGSSGQMAPTTGMGNPGSSGTMQPANPPPAPAAPMKDHM